MLDIWVPFYMCFICVFACIHMRVPRQTFRGLSKASHLVLSVLSFHHLEALLFSEPCSWSILSILAYSVGIRSPFYIQMINFFSPILFLPSFSFFLPFLKPIWLLLGCWKLVITKYRHPLLMVAACELWFGESLPGLWLAVMSHRCIVGIIFSSVKINSRDL